MTSLSYRLLVIPLEWQTVERTERKASRRAGKNESRQTGRQTGRAEQQHLPDCHKRCPLHWPTVQLMEKWSHPLQTPLTSSPRCEADGGLTSVQLYLSGANIAWHEEGAAAERCPRYRPKFSQWNIVFIMSCCVALYPPNMSRARAKQGAVLHYAAHTLFLPP